MAQQPANPLAEQVYLQIKEQIFDFHLLPGDRFTEADASADYLVDRGVPAEAIEQVGGATSYDSIVEAADLLHDRGLDRVLLVSDPYHSLRIRLVAEERGLTAYVSPTRTSPVQGRTAFWREVKASMLPAAIAAIIGARSSWTG